MFGERLTEKKREKNLLDFEDMEHLALQILIKGRGKRTDGAVGYGAGIPGTVRQRF